MPYAMMLLLLSSAMPHLTVWFVEDKSKKKMLAIIK